jgi:hypothetical protein
VPGTTNTSERRLLGARPFQPLGIDGVDNNSDSAGTQNITPQLDSIAEVKCRPRTSRPMRPGGQRRRQRRHTIGVECMHGGAFLYYRDEDMRARSPFENPTAPKPPFQRMYTGGTMAGRIRRDKTHCRESWSISATSSCR